MYMTLVGDTFETIIVTVCREMASTIAAEPR
jgi:hypothetical protein